MPVTRRGTAARPNWLVVLYPEDQWWIAARQAVFPALMTGAAAALAVMAITTVLARRFVRPIQELGRQAAAIAQGQFQPLPVSRRDDEIRDLTLSINRMAETLGRYEQSVRRNERLRTLGQLGAGMAHQLRNAATGAWMAVELHQRQCPGGQDQSALEVAVRQLRRWNPTCSGFSPWGVLRRWRRSGLNWSRWCATCSPWSDRPPPMQKSLFASTPRPNRWPHRATPDRCGKSSST